MAKKRIKDLSTTITAFRTGDVIPVDGPSGTAKMSKDDLLRETAENALGNIHSLSNTATEADLAAGNYFVLDGSDTEKLPADCVAKRSVQEEQVGKITALENAVDELTDSQVNEKTVIPELNIIGGTGWVRYGEVGTQLTYRLSTSLDYGYFILDVSGAKSVLLRFVTALKGNSADDFGVYAVATDENDIILECWTKTFSGATSTVGIATCAIPNGATKLYLNLNIGSNTNGRCTAFITSNVTEYGPAGIVDIADASHSYETQPVTYSVMDYGVNVDAELSEDLNYTHTEIQVLKGEKYLISGGSYWWYPLYTFKPGSSIYYPPTTGTFEVRVHTDVVFEVPYDGTLYINLNADDTNVRDGASIRKIISESDAWTLKKKLINQDNLSNELIAWIQSQSSGSVLAGKKVYDCGDSVMRGAGTGSGHQVSVMEQLAAVCAFDLTHNAVSGYTLGYKDGDSSKSIVQKMITDLTAVTDYDYVIFQGGFNDLSHTQQGEITPVGTTSFDASTTLGALETICYWLVNNYPDAKILFILDHKWYGMRNSQPALWEKIVEVLDKWSIPYVDIYGKTPMNGINHTVRDKWYYFDGDHGDGLHPNTAAYTHFYLGPVKSAMESL